MNKNSNLLASGLALPAFSSFARPMRGLALALMAGLLATGASARNVALTGMMGRKPLLIVDGGAPKAVGVGETYQGIKVISAGSDRATLESEGKRFTVHLGESPVHVGGMMLAVDNTEEAGDGRRIVLSHTGGGHFMTNGTINGKTVRFIVDTGATTIALGQAEADRLGLAYKQGQRVRMQTANGVSTGWRVKLDTVRIKGVQIHNVDATVAPTNMGVALLGNSFLNRFTMTRNGDQMILERRY